MTENKRFILADIGFVYDNEKLIGMKDIVEVMNILHEENQKLFTLSNMKKGALVEAIKDLTDENEQLKKTNQELNDELQETIGYLSLKSGVEKENEQLKQRIKVLEDTVDGLAGTIAHFDLDEVMWND